MKIFLVNPRGFCAGVVRAIETVKAALAKWGSPIYVKHQIVHNRHVVNSLEKQGAIFVEDLQHVPMGAKIIYSAHGVPPSVREEAKKRNLFEIDATCNLVNKVHMAAKRFAEKGYHILLLGHRKHVEIIGTKGQAPAQTTVIEKVEDIDSLQIDSTQKLIYLTQTTLSVDDVKIMVEKLQQKFPHIETIPASCICYATTNRQEGLKNILDRVDVVFVIGDVKSSNSNRLKEVAQHKNIPAYLINSEEDIQEKCLHNVATIGITAGASTPEYLVQDCVKKLQRLGAIEIEEVFYKQENVRFALPKPLAEVL